MRRVLLDSNALDPILTVPGAYEVLEDAVGSARLEVVFTHVTIDEIVATSDLEKRQWLLNLLVFLGRPIYTSGAVVDFSRLNFCRWMADDDHTFEPLRSGTMIRAGNTRHSRDALIAHTALHEECALITNDQRLAARAKDQAVEVLTTAELLAEFGSILSPPPPREAPPNPMRVDPVARTERRLYTGAARTLVHRSGGIFQAAPVSPEAPP